MSAALGIISFTWRWNDYLWPLIVVNNQDKFTLQLSLANLVGTNTVEWGTLLAYAILVLIPVLIVFLLFQRLFLKGQVGAAGKGLGGKDGRKLGRHFECSAESRIGLPARRVPCGSGRFGSQSHFWNGPRLNRSRCVTRLGF